MIRLFDSLPKYVLVTALAALLPTVSYAVENVSVPVEGDPINGGRMFRLHCAACHGLGAEGDGALGKSLAQAPTNLRDGGFTWAHTNDELLSRMRGEMLSPKAPTHGRGLTELELRDLVEWIKEPVPVLSTFFPAATQYVAREQTFDDDAEERFEKVIGREPTDSEKTMVLFALMKGEQNEDGRFAMPGPEGAVKIANNPQSLYVAKPRRRMGFVGYVPLNLKQGRFMIALALNRSMVITGIASVPTADPKSEKLRAQLDRTLQSFVGAGGRAGKKTIVPQTRGVSAAADVLQEMEKAYALVLEAGAMYQKEERDRFWADPDAFKFPAAADMDEVKFDFKEKKAR